MAKEVTLIQLQKKKTHKPKNKSKRVGPTYKQMVSRLDKWVSLVVRQRDPYCVCCGYTETLQCGHYLSRAFHGARWDLRNCNTQCASCNVQHELDPETYRETILAIHGDRIIDELRILAHRPVRWTIAEMLDYETQLKKIYAGEMEWRSLTRLSSSAI